MLGRTSTQKRCAAGRDRSGMLGVSITPSRGRGSPRPRRAERLAFSCCRAWMTALAALPLALVFAILVCVPLALRATGPGGSTGRLLIAAYPIAAVAAILYRAPGERARRRDCPGVARVHSCRRVTR